jgi:hypothetical protein
MTTDGDSLYVGGEFTTVDNSVPQQGLTRFSFLDSGGVNRKPLTPPAPVVTSTRPGVVDVSWRQAEDPDQAELTYQVLRNGNTTSPVFTTRSGGRPWLQSWMEFHDSLVQPGATVNYSIRAVDPMGARSTISPATMVTVASSQSLAAGIAEEDHALTQYSYQSTSGGKYVDGVGGRQSAAGSGVRATNGTSASGKAVSLSGSAGGALVENVRDFSPRSFSIEALVQTTTSRGGVIGSIGDGSSPNGISNSNVGNLYLDGGGRVNWGVKPDGTRSDPWASPFSTKQVVTSSSALNDGVWHHVVGTFEPGSGLRLYVDGELDASNPGVPWSRSVNGYFRVGGDQVSGWPNAPKSAFLAGNVDEAALYPIH